MNRIFLLFTVASSVDYTIARPQNKIEITKPNVRTTFPIKEVEAGQNRFVLKELDHFVVPANDEGAAEYISFDQSRNQVFVVNAADDNIGVYKIDENGGISISSIGPLDVSDFGSPQSVYYHDGVVGVAVENGADGLAKGRAYFFNAATGFLITFVETGVLPDHISFDPQGKCAYTANEGEPEAVNQNNKAVLKDVSGGITQICASDFRDPAKYKVTTLDFVDVLTDEGSLADLESSIHFAQKVMSDEYNIAYDLEPEFITYDKKGKELFVSLQENNAIVAIKTSNLKIDRIMPLGLKDYGLEGNSIDASDKDDKQELNTWEHVVGMYQPDTLTHVSINGKEYLITANEGDAKEYCVDINEDEECITEEVRAGDESISIFDNGLQEDSLLGRLKISLAEGTVNGKDFTKLYNYGARSFSIWDPKDGSLVFDSSNQISQALLKYAPKLFNADDGFFEDADKRSDDKGAEPESIAYGIVQSGYGEEKHLLFLGLERPGIIGIWDISDPKSAIFHSLNTKCGDGEDGGSSIKDPEALIFIQGKRSPTGKPLLIASGSVSNTLTTFELLETLNYSCACSIAC